MAKLEGGIHFSGGMGDLCAYRLPGSDKLIVRRKSGPDRQRILRGKNYENTRKNNAEWSGCVAAVRQVITILYPVKQLAGYNYSGNLHALCKSIQKDDTTNILGQRSILFSQHYYKLEGFSLNREYNFESFVKHPLQYHIDKATASATIQLPEIVPGINLTNPNNRPLYRFVFVLGAVTDLLYNKDRKSYQPAATGRVFPVVKATEWHTARQRMNAASVTLAITNAPDLSNHTLLLAAGIEFGEPLSATEIRPVKRDGAARILKMAF